MVLGDYEILSFSIGAIHDLQTGVAEIAAPPANRPARCRVYREGIPATSDGRWGLPATGCHAGVGGRAGSSAGVCPQRIHQGPIGYVFKRYQSIQDGMASMKCACVIGGLRTTATPH